MENSVRNDIDNMDPAPGIAAEPWCIRERLADIGGRAFLNETLFTSLMQARLALEDWRRDYNNVRPHSRIGWLAPAVYAANFSPQSVQGAALVDGSAPWPVAPTVQDGNRQTLSSTG